MIKKLSKYAISAICISSLLVNSIVPVMAMPVSGNDLAYSDVDNQLNSDAEDCYDDKKADIDSEVAGVDYVEDEVIVVLKETVDDEAAAIEMLEISDINSVASQNVEGDLVDINIESVGDELSYAVVELSDEITVDEAMDYYSELPEVAYVQPNYIYELDENELVADATYPTNDIYYSRQWYLDAIKVPGAWKALQSVNATQQDVIVAIIDTGIDINHPDLKANLDTEHCVSAVTKSYEPITSDFTGHGTHIAGEVAAVIDNSIGVAGISNNHAKIAAICCSDGESITTSRVANGIDYAISIGAGVMNMSLGTNTDDTILRNALEKAYNAGILTICSAGNDGTDQKHYPSGYSSTIGVIATEKDGTKRTSGSYGTDNFISAPGSSNYSTVPTSTYGYKSGSSMSAGVVTGVVALMLSINPDLTPEEIKSLLAETATDTYDTGFDAYSGYGIVNAEAVIKKMLKIDDSGDGDKPDDGDNPGGDDQNPGGGDNLGGDDKNPGGNDSGDDDQIEVPDFIKNPDSIDSFVKRLYYYCLERNADAGGLADWSNRLATRSENGGQVAMGFLFSKEFQNKNLSNKDYVDTLYKVFLGREADAGGEAYWIGKLENGMSRLYVMNGFSGSDEFTGICNRCGFKSGQVVSGEWRDQNEGVTAFVARLYQKALGRSYDLKGVNDWCHVILSKKQSAKEVATNGFFHSQEFANKNTSDSEFVKILYRTFFDREADASGFEYWKQKLRNGSSRDDVIRGFADSQEFANLMAKYGL